MTFRRQRQSLKCGRAFQVTEFGNQRAKRSRHLFTLSGILGQKDRSRSNETGRRFFFAQEVIEVEAVKCLQQEVGFEATGTSTSSPSLAGLLKRSHGNAALILVAEI